MAKPEIHQSDLVTAKLCMMSIENERKYGRVPPGISALRGTGLHASAEKDLDHKIQTGQLLEDEAVKQYAVDAFNNEWETGGVRLTEAELKVGEKKLRGEAVDSLVVMAEAHHRVLAPRISPVAVEKSFRMELPDYPFDLAGRMDIDEHDGFRDTKTKATSPTLSHVFSEETVQVEAPGGETRSIPVIVGASADADDAVQFDMYALHKKVNDGQVNLPIWRDTVVPLKRGPKIVIQKTQRDDTDFNRLLDMVSRYWSMIERGVYYPNGNGTWKCQDAYCGYWMDLCPFGRRKRAQL